jgi:hypothetical protein
LNGNSDLARFLGVVPNTITNWYGNSIDYDLVFSKCEGINTECLLTGRGEMFPDTEHSNIRIDHNVAGGDIVAGRGIVNNHWEGSGKDLKMRLFFATANRIAETRNIISYAFIASKR